MSCESGTVTRRVKSLPEIIIIIISGDQLKCQENIPEYLTINQESNLFMLVLVTLFIPFYIPLSLLFQHLAIY